MRVIKHNNNNTAPYSTPIGTFKNRRWKAPLREMSHNMLITAMRECDTQEHAFVFFKKYGRPSLSGNEKNIALLANTPFGQWLVEWDESSAKTKAEMYKQHNAAGEWVMDWLASSLYTHLVSQAGYVHFYGAKVMQHTAVGKWLGICDYISVHDIQLGSSEPSATTDVILAHLIDLAETTIFKPEGSNNVYRISRIYPVAKEDGSVAVYVCINVDEGSIPFAHLAFRAAIARVTFLADDDRKVSFETPQHYLCRLVDSLFNYKSTHSMERIKHEIKSLVIPNLTLDEKLDILHHHSLSSEYTVLSRNDYAQDFLQYVLKDNVKKAMEVSFEQFLAAK